ncbi:MAG: hypothetical protein ACRD6W_13240 [Nitrososphaerales archaeon]
MKASKQTTSGAPRSSRALSFDDFVPDSEMTENQRAAQFLNWSAENLPNRFCPFVWVTKHAYMKSKLPKLNDRDVETLRRGRMDTIKKILWNEYHRRALPAPRDQEPGVRATTDSDDLAGTDYLRRTRRIAAGVKAAAETREHIDTSAMRNKDLRALVQRTDPIMKELVKADLMKRLELPPHRDDED